MRSAPGEGLEAGERIMADSFSAPVIGRELAGRGQARGGGDGDDPGGGDLAGLPLQRTARGCSAAPTPMIEVATTWVVDTGAPASEAPSTVAAGGELGIQRVQRTLPGRWRSRGVRTMRQPPVRVRGHRGGAGDHPSRARRNVREVAAEQQGGVSRPMLFWASLVPCEKANRPRSDAGCGAGCG